MSRRSFEQRGRGLFFGLAFVVIAAPAALAQTSTGSIRGYVTDSSGNAVAGARVVAVNPATTAQREVATQSNGFYAILGLVPAEYDVTARQIGMAPQKVHVRVLIGEVLPLDFKLGASAVQLEAVTVAAATTGVEMRTSEAATNVTQQQIKDRKSTRLNSSHSQISYAVFCLKKKKHIEQPHHKPTAEHLHRQRPQQLSSRRPSPSPPSHSSPQTRPDYIQWTSLPIRRRRPSL